MDRRQFLNRGLGLLGVAVIPVACGQAISTHDMGNMKDMKGMAGMMDMPPAASAAQPLAALDALPTGLPLPPLPVLANQSSDANHFKATLTAAPIQHEIIAGKPTTIWAYNGSAAPLLIEWVEGMTVEVELINQLPQDTTIHWHGLPVPPEEDGGPSEPVPPQGRRTYRFTLPEGCAGTYWFHPHPHGNTHEQVFRGLAGAIIVRPKTADALAALPEARLFVTDLKLNADGSIADNDANDDMNGREGQFLLVNGRYQPQLNLTQATRVRLWNATNARFLNVQLQGAAGQVVNVVQVGTDGGLLTQAQHAQTVLVSPAERIELLLSSKEAITLGLHALAYKQGKMGMVQPTPARTLLNIQLAAGAVEPPQRLRDITPLGAAMRQQSVRLSETMSMAGGMHNMNFYMNDQQFKMDRIDFTSKMGEVEEWVIDNTSDMDHPIHIHGGQFQLQRREWIDASRGEPTDYPLAWKDTVNLKSGERVVFKMAQQFKGVRMLHCHILEHEDAGMMANIQVV